MERITSAKNPIVKSLRALKDRSTREEIGRCLGVGEAMSREAVSCGLKMEILLAADRCGQFACEMESQGANVCLVPESILSSVCETRTPQGVCACFVMPKPTKIDDLPDLIVALDGVQDPGNVGTIWRTADAAGFQSLLFGPGCADPMSPKVLRAAMGSGFRLPHAQCSDLKDALEHLKDRGYAVIVSVLNGEDFYLRSDPGKRIALVIGNEAHGISDAVRKCATMRVRLPMRGGAESLNAAIAAGIMMYDLMREYPAEP